MGYTAEESIKQNCNDLQKLSLNSPIWVSGTSLHL